MSDENKKELFTLAIKGSKDNSTISRSIDLFNNEGYNYFPIIDENDYYTCTYRNKDTVKGLIKGLSGLNIKKMGLRLFEFPTLPDKKNIFQLRLDFDKVSCWTIQDTNEYYLVIPITPIYGFDVRDDNDGPNELLEIYKSMVKLIDREFGTAFSTLKILGPETDEDSFGLGIRVEKPYKGGTIVSPEIMNEMLSPLIRFIKSSKTTIAYVIYQGED